MTTPLRRDPLPIVLVVLTVTTGLVDAASVLELGRVFTANMTGNVVFWGFAVAGAAGFSIACCATALAGFLAGAAVGGRIGIALSDSTYRPPAPHGRRRGDRTASPALVAPIFASASQWGTDFRSIQTLVDPHDMRH